MHFYSLILGLTYPQWSIDPPCIVIVLFSGLSFFSFFPKQLRVQTRYVFSFLSVITSIETKLEETTKQTGNGNIRTYSCLMCEKR